MNCLLTHSNKKCFSGRGVDNFLNPGGGASSSVKGIIRPPGLNRVNWSAQIPQGRAPRPLLSYTSDLHSKYISIISTYAFGIQYRTFGTGGAGGGTIASQILAGLLKDHLFRTSANFRDFWYLPPPFLQPSAIQWQPPKKDVCIWPLDLNFGTHFMKSLY